MKRNKIILVGTSSIVEFHVNALRKSGLNPTTVASSNKKSSSQEKFSAENNIKKSYSDWKNMIDEEEYGLSRDYLHDIFWKKRIWVRNDFSSRLPFKALSRHVAARHTYTPLPEETPAVSTEMMPGSEFTNRINSLLFPL